jgi:hypothetical protein
MPHAINPKVPESVERVLLKALAKDRLDRYPNVEALVQGFKDAWVEAGVPMQGTAITMRAAASRADAPTLASAAAIPAAPTDVAKAAPAKNTSPWPFLAGGAILLVCLGIAAVAAVRAGLLRPSVPVGPLPTAAASQVAVPVQSGAIDTPIPPPADTPVPAVATALQAAHQAPGDPQGQLALSLAYWDAAERRASLVTLARASDLAGRRNTKFFQAAADQFRQRQAWIAAAAMDVRAIKSLGPGVPPSDGLRNSFHEALYKASNQADVPAYLSFDDLAVVEQPITLVAQARHLYYNGDTVKAHEILNQVRTLKPHMAEASLLEAEMDANEGRTFDARQTLNILLADLSTPDWMREMAQTLSNKIP